MILIRTHIASEPDVLHQLMGSLFNTLLLTSHANHWAITRAILSLMLASEASFAGTILETYNSNPHCIKYHRFQHKDTIFLHLLELLSYFLPRILIFLHFLHGL